MQLHMCQIFVGESGSGAAVMRPICVILFVGEHSAAHVAPYASIYFRYHMCHLILTR